MSEQDFYTMIDNRSANAGELNATVPGDTHDLKFGKSRLSIRRAGGYLMNLQLCEPGSNKAVDVAYTYGNGNRPQLVAGRLALTIQPNRGSGVPKSWPKWADWDPVRPVIEYEDQNALFLKADTPETFMSCMRKYYLSKSSLMTVTKVNSVRPMSFSIGQHDLYPLESGRFGEIQINGVSLRDTFTLDMLDAINQGHGTYYPEFDGTAQIDFPEGNSIYINASATVDRDRNLIPGLFLSRRINTITGSPFPCIGITPTLGFERTTTFNNTLRYPGIGPHAAELQVVTGLAAHS